MKCDIYQTGKDNRQSVICNSSHIEMDNWDRDYVYISGFFGANKPETFANAPELLDALENIVNAIYDDKLSVKPSDREFINGLLISANKVIDEAEGN